jgi:hypothetical protein
MRLGVSTPTFRTLPPMRRSSAGGEVLAIIEVEEMMDVGAVRVGEQGEDLGGEPAPAREGPSLQLAQPRAGHGRLACGVQAEAGRMRVDLVGRFLERPPERMAESDTGPVAIPSKLGGDLVPTQRTISGSVVRCEDQQDQQDQQDDRRPAGRGRCGEGPSSPHPWMWRDPDDGEGPPVERRDLTRPGSGQRGRPAR